MRRINRRAPLFFPIMLVLVGLVVLLNNFLLIETNIINLWPLVLIVIGLQVIWRGDLAPSWEAQTFGITRGSVETASLEISSAEIDVKIRPLGRAGRLIAGQYTARSRPRLAVRNNHASLVMRRGETWWFSLADWDISLAQDLPWSLLMSAHLGEVQADLRGITLQQAHIATGIGDIRLICPDQPTGPLYVRSAFGDIYLLVPSNAPALIHARLSPMVRVIRDPAHFKMDETGKFFAAPAYRREQPSVAITVVATFGNVLLSLTE